MDDRWNGEMKDENSKQPIEKQQEQTGAGEDGNVNFVMVGGDRQNDESKPVIQEIRREEPMQENMPRQAENFDRAVPEEVSMQEEILKQASEKDENIQRETFMKENRIEAEEGQQGKKAESNDQNRADDFTQNKEPQRFYQERVKPKKDTMFKKIIAACLVVSIAGGGSIGVGYALTKNLIANGFSKKTAVTEQTKNTEDTKPVNNSLAVASSINNENSNAAVQIIKDVFPSVVSINTKVRGTTEYFSGFLIPYEGEGAGSGVIFSEDDNQVYIVTNYHVVDGATDIAISINGTDTVAARVVSTDSTSELAVISVLKTDLAAAGIDQVTVATFGDSDELEIGESVIAIGNALGQGKTATGGMISAIGKVINVDGKELNVIQLDAAINPGNSGGALVNYDGKVVGINTAKAGGQSAEGMGYAIPSNSIQPVVERLLSEGKNGKPYLGILGENVTDDLAELYGLPVGILVRQVVEGSSADLAGIEPGDIITDFAGEKMMEMNDLVESLAVQKVGDTVEVRIIRDGKKAINLKATIQDANKQ